jgi:hypothetical protein
MMPRFFVVALATAAITSALGCSTVCEDADELCADTELYPEPECTGAWECSSNCIAEAETCDFIRSEAFARASRGARSSTTPTS